jgi:enamine deaminase RidA (YjgF/YER057c/UK114 family)
MTQDTVSSPSQLSNPLSELVALLPPPPLPIGSYVATVQVGNLVHTSGVLPMKEGQVAVTGAVGSWDVSVAEGQEAARLCILNALSLVQHALGSLDRVKRIVKLTGFVNSAPNFYEQPQVMNAASDLLVQYFGEAGKHVRSAVGVASLPKNASVELELVVEVL